MLKRSIYIIIITLLFIYTEAIGNEGNKYVKVELISSNNYFVPGENIPVALKIQVANDWHIYWLNSGDSGMPTKIEWILPEGFTVNRNMWPYPQRFEFHGMADYGYEKFLYVLSNINTPTDYTGDFTIKAKIDFLVCKSICVPGSLEVQLKLEQKEQIGKDYINHKHNQEIGKQIQYIPTPKHDFKFNAIQNGSNLLIVLEPDENFNRNIEKLLFFPYNSLYIENGAEQILEKNENNYQLKLTLDSYRDSDPDTVSGVLVSKAGLAFNDILNIWVNAIEVNIPVIKK